MRNKSIYNLLIQAFPAVAKDLFPAHRSYGTHVDYTEFLSKACTQLQVVFIIRTGRQLEPLPPAS
jgi:hypothetical protein